MNSANVSEKFGVEIEMFDGFTFPIKKDALCLLKIVINLYIWTTNMGKIDLPDYKCNNNILIKLLT